MDLSICLYCILVPNVLASARGFLQHISVKEEHVVVVFEEANALETRRAPAGTAVHVFNVARGQSPVPYIDTYIDTYIHTYT